jgi:hypothetical protein
MNNVWANLKEKVSSKFQPKVDWKSKYTSQVKQSDQWEFKYNKLHRQLNAILEQSNLDR